MLKNSELGIVVLVIILVGSTVGGLAFLFNHQHPGNTNPVDAASPQSIGCGTSEPLSLSETQEGDWGAPSVDLDWKNCTSQEVQFTLDVSALNVTISTFGSSSTVQGYLGQAPGTVYSVQPGGQSGVILPIEFTKSVSPNALVQQVSGSVAANDPVTKQALSIQNNFTA